MFTDALDPTYVVALGLFSGPDNDDADFERYVERLGYYIDAWSDREHATLIQLVEPQNPPPDAHWRKRIAEVSRRAPSHVQYVFVGGSRLARGVVTAISWLAPRNYDMRVCETLEEAIAIVRATRPVPEHVFETLLREARAAAGL